MNIFHNPHRGHGLTDTSLADIPYPSTNRARPSTLLERCPRAAITPLIEAGDIAQSLGIAALHIKDERGRMGLGSFKALGAAYVIASDAEEGQAQGKTYVTASAGNHGLSVAAGAAAFKANAEIFLSEQVPEAFAQRLRDIGARVIRAGETYEASMEAAAAHAETTGATLLSDSSWEGYTALPHRLMEGYLVLMDEVFDQLATPPTHIFLQAGVGGLAGAAAAAARDHWGDGPRIVVVEPEAAPALFASMQAGRAVTTDGPVSIMGRLDCKEPSLIALKGLARDADDFVTITERTALQAADRMAEHGLPTTPSGAAGLAAAMTICSEMDDAFNIDANARILTILSEGPEG